MPTSFVIRPATATDAHAVGILARQFADYLRELGDTTEFKLTAEAYLRDGFGPTPAFAGLVAAEESIIGYLLYHFGYDSDAAIRNFHVVDLYVEPNFRKRGVGRALMTKAATIARDGGAEEMIWSVYTGNTAAADFYENLGARRINDVFLMKANAAALSVTLS